MIESPEVSITIQYSNKIILSFKIHIQQGFTREHKTLNLIKYAPCVLFKPVLSSHARANFSFLWCGDANCITSGLVN